MSVLRVFTKYVNISIRLKAFIRAYKINYFHVQHSRVISIT